MTEKRMDKELKSLLDDEWQDVPATKRLHHIIDHGNRGHQHMVNNFFECSDGYQLSVVAGGNTYSVPRPESCTCALEGVYHVSDNTQGDVPHDYPGHYTSVEIADLAELKRSGGGVSQMTTTELYELIEEHEGLVEL